MKNYYEILEVNNKASQEVIEKAYKVLVKKYHPDLYTNQINPEANKKIKEINEAYEVLSNHFLREQYNLELQKEENRVKQEIRQKRVQKPKEVKQANDNNKKYKVGTLSGIIELIKELYKNKPKREEIKELTKKDFIAVILTIIVLIIIGIILWFIPFTNGWMRELLFENPLFSWISK